MFNQEIIDSFQKDLDKSNSVLVLLPPEPDEILVNSGLGLYLSLQNLGKKTQIGCSKLDNPGPIKTSIGNKNLIINFQFKEKDLDKVDYDVDEQGNFQLMVKPKDGSPPPDSKNISYIYSGANADLVIVLGINSLEELGKLYSDEKKFLDQANIVSLNKDSRPGSFATHNFHTNSATSIAEVTSFLLLKTKIKPTSEAANNLLKEIYSTTNNLSTPRVTADTFEVIAFLIRNGARPPVTSTFTPPPVFDQPTPLNQIPPAQVPSDWKKPKIFRSSPSR
ncbi:hypothetical protein KJ953_03005 [Patescibacteria group bacterium]|nr:hypothetical protein [Patescibacteria group bacterium]MBU1256528.1 hypothetical protein [Patescibacteria group bacterium]MBU1457541.1 hypothetical protein [Patescibacteria group bacterium]